MKKKNMLLIKGSTIVFSLAILAGCDFLKKKEAPKMEEPKAAGAVLCTINGDVAITESDFVNNLNQLVQSNPYFRGATAESLPKELQRKFFEQLTTQAIIEKYSVKTNVEQDPEYIKAYNETEKLLKRSLMVQIFEKKIYDTIKVSDGDISKYYSENKDRFVKAAGGVLAMGAHFDNDSNASAFLSKVKDNGDNFEKLAKADKSGKFKDFGRVSKESRGMQMESVPAPVKETVFGMTKLPGIEKVKTGKDFWVVRAWDKKDTILFEEGEVKSHIESMLKNNQFKDAVEKRVKELKGDFKIVVNEDYFKEPKQAEEKNKGGAQGPKEDKAVAEAA